MLNFIPSTSFLPQFLPLSHNPCITSIACHPRRTTTRKSPPTCQWQDSLLPFPPSSARLATLLSSFPHTTGDIHLIGFSADTRTAYLTLHFHSLPGSRPKYAISSFAFPLPLSTSNDKLFLRESFLYLNPGCSIPPTPLPRDANSIRLLLPSSVRSLLSADLNRIAAALPWKRLHNRLDIALHALELSSASLVAACLYEVPMPGGIGIEARVYLRQQGSAAVEEVNVPPAWAIGMAAGTRVGCFMARQTFEKCGVKVVDMESVFSSGGIQTVVEDVKWEKKEDSEEMERKTEERLRDAWSLSTDEVLGLDENGIYRLLEKHGIRMEREGWVSGLRALLPFLDEVVRREIGMRLAAENEDLKLAAELEKGRSERGKLRQELREKEKEGSWSEVVRIAQRIRWIEDGIADITAEPGSYNKDLDRDEWYRPNR